MTTEIFVSERIVAADIELDPFRYGWRYLHREQPDGTVDLEQVPLSLADVLYPEVGDFVVHSKAHEDRCLYLASVFSAQLKADPAAVILHDVRVAWDVPGLRPNGPDIAVILGAREVRNWSTFDVREEGVRPALIIEVTSPETRSIDVSTKLEIYAQAGVPLYVIVDTRRGQSRETLHLLGYQLTADGYEVLHSDARGWLWLEPVGLWIGLRDNEVYCFDTAGKQIAGYVAMAAAYAEAEQRAASEAQARSEAEQRANAAESRMQELEAELRRLRGQGDG